MRSWVYPMDFERVSDTEKDILSQSQRSMTFAEIQIYKSAFYKDFGGQQQ